MKRGVKKCSLIVHGENWPEGEARRNRAARSCLAFVWQRMRGRFDGDIKTTPSSRIRTSDLWITAALANYSPPLYQLSYRRKTG